MRIAYCLRDGYLSGGDGVQAVKTREYIMKLHNDVIIDIITDPQDLTAEYQIAHIFNYATYELTRRFFESALSLGIKIVSSPVYWDYSYSLQPLPLIKSFKKDFISERYLLFYRKISIFLSNIPLPQFKKAYFFVSNFFKKEVKFFIDNSQFILPNSQEEGVLCCKFSGIGNQFDKVRVIYNGVDLAGVNILPEEEFFNKYKIPKNYVLQVGRIEYLKNQLNLLSALYDDRDIPIVFLGNTTCSPLYTANLKRLAEKRGNVYFVSGVPHNEVYSFYRYAKTHVLLSMRESPGLVSLEALSQACPVVVADKRCLPLDSYFNDQFESVNPLKKKQIRDAVLISMGKEHKSVSMEAFNWKNIAMATYGVYKELNINE